MKQKFTELETLSVTDPSEMWSHLKKLSNPPSTRAALQIVRADQSISNDVREVLERWHNDIARLFSGLRENPDFAFDDQFYQEIIDKKSEFENLSETEQMEDNPFNADNLNEKISLEEVSKAIDKAKSRKAYLTIPK